MKKWMGGLLGATLVALISGLAWLAISSGTARAKARPFTGKARISSQRKQIDKYDSR